jgi:GNAT superfamily N-acetyltransferase
MIETSRSPEVQIRPIKLTEMPELLALYTHLHPLDAPLPAQETLQALWDQIMADPRLHYIVAEAQGQLVASCTLTIIPNLTRGARPYGLIENVVTHAAYRRRGIGAQVLRAALSQAWQEHCYKVLLLTGSQAEATLRFYQQAGFKRGIKTGFIATPPEA